MTRKETLEAAITCVCSNRCKEYGSPEDSFQLIADLWNTYYGSSSFSAHDVGIMMALLKIARIATGQFKDDSYVDAAGYIACAAEIAAKENANETRTEQPANHIG
jgi:hypothetical protein